MWREFKPAIRFVAVFVGVYLVGNFLYGIYIHSLGHQADHFTRIVSHETTWVLNFLGGEVRENPLTERASISLLSNEKSIINIFEGCNGVNVAIVFVAFILSFGGEKKKVVWFIFLGLVIINFVNVIRLALLYWVAARYHSYFYFIHKYFFTAIIYAVVFLLWVTWIRMQRHEQSANA